jgi:hypothetical protein
MFAKKSSKKLTPILVILLLLFCPFTAVQVESSDHINWQNLETKYTIIHYQNLEDLKKFDDKIDFSPGKWGIKSLFSSSDSKQVKDKLASRVDALFDVVYKEMDSIFEKVQEILDMRKKMKKVKINIYGNKRELHAAFYKIYKKKCRIRSWYLYERKTIYINVDDLHEGILAHEMAHHVHDNYLIIRPPRATAEILARYVDKHLFDEVKKY